jgi:hypothetical protein
LSKLNTALEGIAEWLEEYGPAHLPILIRYALLERYTLMKAREMGHDINICTTAFKNLWIEANDEGIQIAILLGRYLEGGGRVEYFRERPELVEAMGYFMALGDIEYFRGLDDKIVSAATERAARASSTRLNKSYAN